MLNSSFSSYLIGPRRSKRISESVSLAMLNSLDTGGPELTLTRRVTFNNVVEVKTVEKFYTSNSIKKKNFYTSKEIEKFSRDFFEEGSLSDY